MAAAKIFFPLFWQGQIGSSNTFETQHKIEKARLQSFLQSKCLEQHQRALQRLSSRLVIERDSSTSLRITPSSLGQKMPGENGEIVKLNIYAIFVYVIY